MPPSRPPLFSPHAWRTTWPCSRSRSSRWRSSPCFQCCAAGFRWGSLLTFILPLCSRLFILFQTTPAPVQAGLTVALVLLALGIFSLLAAMLSFRHSHLAMDKLPVALSLKWLVRILSSVSFRFCTRIHGTTSVERRVRMYTKRRDPLGVYQNCLACVEDDVDILDS